MITATVAVSLLIWLTLGFRESWIVFLAIPTTLFPTLACFYLYGYTLNRITLFALIFSIGILVDDAIVVVENIARHMRMVANRGRAAARIAVEAVSEVGNPSILATFTIIAAVLPMAFVSGLMGPYMEPIPIGSASAVTISTLVAFIITPWAAIRFLKPRGENEPEEREDWTTRLYRRVMRPLLHQPVVRNGFLLSIVVLLVGAMALVGVGWVKVKMLPFDNKSEFQVIVDLPEGTPLEETARVTQLLAERVLDDADVVDVQLYVGTSAPYSFNGLVRHYFLRGAPHEADIQVTLTASEERDLQSHDVAKRTRDSIAPLAAELGALIKVAEVPPGPPVLQTLVAEVYGPTAAGRDRIAADVRDIFETTDGIVDVDWSVQEPQSKLRFVVNEEKAALHGIGVDDIVQVLEISAGGRQVGLIHDPDEKEDLPLVLQLERSARSSQGRLLLQSVRARDGALVPLSELVQVEHDVEEQSIFHKNLMPVTYVTADVAGEIESPVYAMLRVQPRVSEIDTGDGFEVEQLTASLPASDERFALKWDGEWHITYEVFRDLGVAFGVVMVLIYVLLVGWFKSFVKPLVIMSAIPFSLIGILPAHGLLGAFFTATSMIGFIAGAGIVIRNSIILVDFVELRRRQGMALAEAVIDAGAIRFRPMMLTASSLVVGAAVMLVDPIFQGLAISLMAGEVASLLLSRMTVPVVYYLTERKQTP
jgi:multidrug efflux pump subunit AcrB